MGVKSAYGSAVEFKTCKGQGQERQKRNISFIRDMM